MQVYINVPISVKPSAVTEAIAQWGVNQEMTIGSTEETVMLCVTAEIVPDKPALDKKNWIDELWEELAASAGG